MARTFRSFVLLSVAAGYLSYAALCVAEGEAAQNWRVAVLAPVSMPAFLVAASVAYLIPIEPPPRAMLIVGWSGYLAPFAAAWVARALRDRRERVVSSRSARGCCRSCGYDLRASPDRCPECGAVPKPASG